MQNEELKIKIAELLPTAVFEELTRNAAPAKVRDWMQQCPAWLEILDTPNVVSDDASLHSLDPGERPALILAESLHADLLLMDDRAGALVAQGRGFAVTGTLGVLDLAARGGLLDLQEVVLRLQKTNFRYPPSLVEALLKEDKNRKDAGK